MGWNAQPTRAVIFDNVRVPAANRLGKEGDGFKIAMAGLDGGRLNIAACSLGGAQSALEKSLAYMKERKAFGKRLDEFQALQFRLADMATALEASRAFLWHAAAALDRKDANATALCAMAKRFVTDACFDVANQALQLHGGYGYLVEYGIEKIVRDLRVHQILEGTNEIMRLIVAQTSRWPMTREDHPRWRRHGPRTRRAATHHAQPAESAERADARHGRHHDGAHARLGRRCRGRRGADRRRRRARAVPRAAICARSTMQRSPAIHCPSAFWATEYHLDVLIARYPQAGGRDHGRRGDGRRRRLSRARGAPRRDRTLLGRHAGSRHRIFSRRRRLVPAGARAGRSRHASGADRRPHRRGRRDLLRPGRHSHSGGEACRSSGGACRLPYRRSGARCVSMQWPPRRRPATCPKARSWIDRCYGAEDSRGDCRALARHAATTSARAALDDAAKRFADLAQDHIAKRPLGAIIRPRRAKLPAGLPHCAGVHCRT